MRKHLEIFAVHITNGVGVAVFTDIEIIPTFAYWSIIAGRKP